MTRVVVRDLRKYCAEGLLYREDGLMCLLFVASSVKFIYGRCKPCYCLGQRCFVEKIGFGGIERPVDGFGIIWRFGTNVELVWFSEIEGH